MGLFSCFSGQPPTPKAAVKQSNAPAGASSAGSKAQARGGSVSSHGEQKTDVPGTRLPTDALAQGPAVGVANVRHASASAAASEAVATGSSDNVLVGQPVTVHQASLEIGPDKEAKPLPKTTSAVPAPKTQPVYPSTFDVLTRNVPFPSGRPEALQGLRPSCRALQVCSTPAEMLWDVDHLTYINRGSTSVVFHGVWQGAEVAVKFLLATFNEHSASVREALLGAELSHPNVVRCFTARCCTLSEAYMAAQDMENIPTLMAQRALNNTTAAQLPKSLFRNSFDSEDGFGPPPCTMMMLQLARSSNTSASSVNTQPVVNSDMSTTLQTDVDSSASSFSEAGAGQDGVTTANKQLASAAAQLAPPASREGGKRSPWTGDLNWATVLKTLRATAGKVLTMIVSEYCDMGTLSTAIHEKRVFDMTNMCVPGGETSCIPLRALLRTACDATLGLHHLHQAGIIHGDIKPGNMLLIGARHDRRGFRVKLSDLGTARVTALTIKDLGGSCPNVTSKAPASKDVLLKATDKGTIAYMAPEHFAGILVEASDIYSWGVVMWEMCHGVVPFCEFSEAEISQGVVTGRLQLTWNAAVPLGLADLVSRCMHHAPAKRPTTSEILTQLAIIEAQLREDIRFVRGASKGAGLSMAMQPLPQAQGADAQAPAVSPAPEHTQDHTVAQGVDYALSAQADTNVTRPAAVPQQPSVPQLQAHLRQLAVHAAKSAAAARADKHGPAAPAPVPAPAPVQNYWPQLPPLLRAPKHVTMQGAEKTPEELAKAQAKKVIDNPAAEAEVQAVLKAPYRAQNLNAEAVQMLLQRGAALAMQQAREQHQAELKAAAAAAQAGMQPSTQAAQAGNHAGSGAMQPTPVATPAAQPNPAVAMGQSRTTVPAFFKPTAGAQAQILQATVPARMPATPLGPGGEEMEVVIQGIQVKWQPKAQRKA